MYVKLILAMNLSVLIVGADRPVTDIRDSLPRLPVSSNFSHFFNDWKLNSEKMEGKKRKELVSKLTALQNLYDDRNWKPLEHEHFFSHNEGGARNMPVPLYDSLLTRRTFTPSFKTILIELSLMTLSIVAVNAVENALAQTKKPQKITKPGRHRLYTNNKNNGSNEALH